MTDVATKTPVGAKKGAAKTDGNKAKGYALAETCIKYANQRMEEEEKQAGKLGLIVKSISDLTHEGHLEFRAKLQEEVQLLKSLRDSVGLTKEQTKGYAFSSFEVLCSNWRTISTACELGLKTEGKAWSLVLSEAVAMKHAHASDGATGAQLPTKRKAGRKATPLIDKAIKAAEALSEDDFVKFAAWVEKTMKAMQAQ